MRDAAIETANLRKIFDRKVAVRDLTLTVGRGEVFGFLGPNGAGKSTSVKMLLGLVKPTAGQAFLLGRPLGDLGVRRRIGFLPEHFRFHEWLTGEEFLRLHGRLYGMSAATLRKRVPDLLELAGLADHGGKRLKDYSKGMLQRIGLVQALLNQPDLIFLDEPTSGLDPAGRLLVRDIIRAERARGASVFLNSHLLSEVEVTCDRVAFIKHGEVLETHELAKLGADELSITARVKDLTPEAARGLERWAASIRRDGDGLEMRVASEDALPEIVSYLVANGARVYSLHSRQASLEEMFLRIVGTDGGL
jgi:ABC-2 type transport system ATP-binding protein